MGIQAFPTVMGWQRRATVSRSLWPPQDQILWQLSRLPRGNVGAGSPMPLDSRSRGADTASSPGVAASKYQPAATHPACRWGAPIPTRVASPPLDPRVNDIPAWALREPREPLNQRHIVDLVRLHWLSGSAAHHAIAHELRTGYATPMSAAELRSGLRWMHLQRCDMAWYLRYWLSTNSRIHSDAQSLFNSLWRYLEQIEDIEWVFSYVGSDFGAVAPGLTTHSFPPSPCPLGVTIYFLFSFARTALVCCLWLVHIV